MDFKIRGGTWVGNIYHKFETICQEVDDFVTKDTIKYVENQMQTVGESVKKIYSNVVHDVLPPLGDNRQAKAQVVTMTQTESRGSLIRSMVGIKENHRHSSDGEPYKEQDTVDLRSCDTSQVGHLLQLSPPPSSDSPQVAETNLDLKDGSDAAIYSNREMAVEENAAGEGYPEARNLSSPRGENSSDPAIYCREQHLLTENLESSQDGNLSGSSETSNQDQRNIILSEFSPRDLVEDAMFSISQTDTTTCNNIDLSEEAECLSLKQDGETAAIHKSSEEGIKENATVEGHIAYEQSSELEAQNSCKVLCTKELQSVTDDLRSLEDKSSSVGSSTDEDYKAAILMEHSQEIWVPDSVLRDKVVPMEQAVDNNVNPCEGAAIDLSSEQEGIEAGVRKEHLLVDNRGCLNYKSSYDLSLGSMEENPMVVHSTLEDKIVCRSLLISTNEEHMLTTMDKYSPEWSVKDEGPTVIQDKVGVCNRPSCSSVTETDLSLDGCFSCMSLDLGVEENDLVEKHAVTEYSGCPEHKSSCNLYLSSRDFCEETDGINSPKAENSSESSLISRTEDQRRTIMAKISPVTSSHDSGIASQKDETACNSFSDVLGIDISFPLAPSCISSEHNVAVTEASTSSESTELLDVLELSHANSTQKNEEVRRNYTDSSVYVSSLSSISSAAFSGLASDREFVNLIPAFRRADSSTDTSTTNEKDSLVESSGNKPQQFDKGILDDSGHNKTDAYMGTINLSDEARLEKSCVVKDNEILYASTCRPRKFRSYKKLIQDAFASRKRLIKEYELLPVWFGDVDTNNIHSEQCTLPCVMSAPRVSRANDLGESEWELV